MNNFSAFMQRWLGNKSISRVIMILIGLAVTPALVVTVSMVIREIAQIKFLHEEYRAIVEFHPLEEITSHGTQSHDPRADARRAARCRRICGTRPRSSTQAVEESEGGRGRRRQAEPAAVLGSRGSAVRKSERACRQTDVLVGRMVSRARGTRRADPEAARPRRRRNRRDTRSRRGDAAAGRCHVQPHLEPGNLRHARRLVIRTRPRAARCRTRPPTVSRPRPSISTN